MTKKRGLGRSLDALLVGSSANTLQLEQEENNSPDKLCQLAVETLERGQYQPRRGMDSEALEELANSIRSQGVIQPIVVRHRTGGRYEIIAGERRWRAAQLAGLTHIPAIVKEIPDEAAIAIALIENIQRENLNPVEEAMALQRLIGEFAMTHNQVAEAVGKSRTSVTNLLRLLSLTESVKRMLENGDLEMGHARALLTLSATQQEHAAQNVVNNRWSVRETEDHVRKLQQPKVPSVPKSIDPDIKRIQQDLTDRLQMKIAIQANAKGRGRLVIHYSNLLELDKLLEYFQ